MASISNKMPFGIVTVMDLKVYSMSTELTIGSETKSIEDWYKAKANRADFNAQLLALTEEPLCVIDHLQVATLSTEGPSVEIQGGKFNNKLIKYGKTARCEMTDALGQMDALVALGGAEYLDENNPGDGIVVTDKFGGPVCMVGESFVVDQKTGKHVPVQVILYEFLPDSTPSFAFDSGNAATFDLNGDLLAVEFADDAVGNACGDGSGAFFAIEFTPCDLNTDQPSGAQYAYITYDNNVSGPAKMKIGQEYTLTVAANKTAWAKNLDTGVEISITGTDHDKITIPSNAKRVLIAAF